MVVENLQNPEALRDRQAKLMVRFLGKVKDIEVFQGRNLEQVLATEDSRREFVEHLSNEQFEGLLNGINGLLRGKDKADWQMDGKGVILTSELGWIDNSIPPRFEDKDDLLEQAFDGARTMATNGRSLEDIATLLSVSINEIHPYADANGRTSRLVYTLLTKGYGKDVEPEIKEVLGEDGRDHIDISPTWLKRYVEDVIAIKLGIDDKERNPNDVVGVHYLTRPLEDVKFKEEVSKAQQDELLNILDDNIPAFLALFKYTPNLPEPSKYVKSYPRRNVIMIDWMIPDLSPSDLDQIIQAYWEIKKQYAEVMIDLIANPDRPEYQVKENDQESRTILSIFKERVAETAKRKAKEREEN